VHPYDDPAVIAGQGTIGMEILRQYSRPIHAIFVPIGGGGLIAGIASYVKRLRPDIRIIGVEPVDAATMYHALQQGQRVELPQVGLFADGVAVKMAGEETFRLCQHLVVRIGDAGAEWDLVGGERQRRAEGHVVSEARRHGDSLKAIIRCHLQDLHMRFQTSSSIDTSPEITVHAAGVAVMTF
jgi:hypothetical protein